MALKDEVLKYLSSHTSDYVSGEELAKMTGKSRAAIWKAIKSLQTEGYTISAVTNRGYHFDSENDILNEDEIKKNLDFNCKVLFYKSIDSTNTSAKKLIANGENEVMLLVAEEQTAGRGRQGKSFYSPAKTGVYLSLVVHPMTELKNAITATTAASVAVCKAIERLTNKEPKIKWVNDIYLDDKKICGILTEAVTDFETQTVTSVVIGIGINLSTKDFPTDVDNASSLNANIKRAEIVAEIANQLNKIITEDYEGFIEYYRSHSMIIGKDINFISNGQATPAKALGIDNQGGLEIELLDGTKTTLRSGEISIRLK